MEVEKAELRLAEKILQDEEMREKAAFAAEYVIEKKKMVSREEKKREMELAACKTDAERDEVMAKFNASIESLQKNMNASRLQVSSVFFSAR